MKAMPSMRCRRSIAEVCGKDSPAPLDAVLDLQGGIYLLDSPLVVNSTVRCSGTLRIRSGTLLGSAVLGSLGSNHSFLVTVLDYWGGLGVSLEQLVFASNSHGGGLRVDAAHHVHVSDSNFLNFALFPFYDVGISCHFSYSFSRPIPLLNE